MHEEANFEHRFSVMVTSYLRCIDLNDPRLGLDAKHGFLLYKQRPRSCWFMSASTNSLGKLDSKVRLLQVHLDTLARVLLDWQHVKFFVMRPRERTKVYVGVEAFRWNGLHGRRFLIIPAPFDFLYYSSLDFDSIFRPLFCLIAPTEFRACAFF